MQMYKIEMDDMPYYVVADDETGAVDVLVATEMDIGEIESVTVMLNDFEFQNEDDMKIYTVSEWIELNPEPAFIGWVE